MGGSHIVVERGGGIFWGGGGVRGIYSDRVAKYYSC